MKKLLRRRVAIEPLIGHLKQGEPVPIACLDHILCGRDARWPGADDGAVGDGLGRLEVGRRLSLLTTRSDDVVHLILSFGHSLGVLSERSQATRVGGARLVAQQLCELILERFSLGDERVSRLLLHLPLHTLRVGVSLFTNFIKKAAGTRA